MRGRELILIALLALIPSHLVWAIDSSTLTPTKLEAFLNNQNITVSEKVAAVIEATERLPGVDKAVPQALRKEPAFLAELGAAVEMKVADYLKKGATAEARLYIDLANEVLPAGNISKVKIERLVILADRLEHLTATGNFEAISALEKEAKTANENGLIDVFRFRIQFERAELARKEGNYWRVLQAVSSIPPKSRSARANDISREAIAKLAASPSGEEAPELLAAKEMLEFISTLDSNDDGLKLAVASLLADSVIVAVRRDLPGEAAKLFAEVLRRRPDPNPDNDRLRMSVLKSAQHPRTKAFAWGRLKELQESGALTFVERVSLISYGYFSGTLILTVQVVLGGIFVVLLLYYFPYHRFRKVTQYVQKVELPQREKKKLPGYMKSPVGVDEYTRLLELLGLESGAGEDDIKRAYRKMIKELHPDAQAEPDQEKEAQFRELRAVYEKLMNMKSGWFGRGD